MSTRESASTRTALGTAVASVSASVESFGDGVQYAASPQVAAVLPGCVGLVGQDMAGCAARSAHAEAGHRHPLQDGLQFGSVTVVPRRQSNGERSNRPSAARRILVVKPPRERPRHSPI